MLRVPLNVRLTTANGDKHVTRRLHDLQLGAVVPGGFSSATLSFDQPLALTDPAVGIYGKVYIYDGRTGATVWEGRQEDPGRGSSATGQVWTLNAFGGSVHTLDRSDATACYVDKGVESFAQVNSFGLQTGQINTTDDDIPQIKVTVPNGAILGGGTTRVVAVSKIASDCGSKLARYKAVWSAGITDAAFEVELQTMPTLAGTHTVVKNAALNTGGGTLTAVITTDIPNGDSIAAFDIHLTGSARTNGDDQHWASASVVIQGTRYTRAGVELTAGATYNTDTVLASDVVADLLGRWLNQYDGANASIDATAFTIDRLVYPDPTTPSQILDDLMALESGYFWAAWESTGNGYRFVWQAWPTTVRYECSIDDDFDSPGDVGDLYNAVLVRYRDTNGRPRTVRVSGAQTDLDNAGIIRCADIDLGDNVGSKANATQAGTRFLLDHNSPPNQGTLNISAPILDLISGRMVAPWEIQPGNLIRVRGVLPRVDALNATDRDAVTVFRMVGTTYTASSNTCQVALDSLGRGTADQITDAHKRITKLRKR